MVRRQDHGPHRAGHGHRTGSGLSRPEPLTIALLSRVGGGGSGDPYFEAALQQAIYRVQPTWRFRRIRIAPGRGHGDVRLPFRLLDVLPPAIAEAIARNRIGRADIYHRMELSLPSTGRREVLTIHDLAPLCFPDEGTISRRALQRIHRARAVVALSEFTRRELLKATGRSDIEVVYPGVGEPYLSAAPATPERLAALGINAPYVVHASGATRRKNLDGLAAAWRLAARRLPGSSLVVTGGRDERRLQATAGLAGAIVLDRMPQEDLASVMASAAAIVVPSVYEGFGLPVLEGFAVRVPVVAVQAGALPEAAGDCAVLVDPSPEAIAEGIERALSGGSELNDLVARGRERALQFSWEAAAHAYLAVYERLLTRA